MPATVLAERVGWPGSIRWFRDNVNRVRADHRPIDPADRLTWEVGETDIIAIKGASCRLRDRGIDTLCSITAEQESLR